MSSHGAETADTTAPTPSTSDNRRVKNNNVIVNTNWTVPLAAAPSAISTMAILLKAADLGAAPRLEVESYEVRADDGTAVGHLSQIQVLKHKPPALQRRRPTWLPRCPAWMNTVHATAQSMISVDDSTRYIIDLPENPEDAIYNLKPEIDAIN
ncbi:hypothetical protein QQZ08_007945 [Neonectria magnoliae]|uniref:Uncharacterized protein n=1 Tax=Neonectria magnoliae TaxID=2732573 RepID=A0ABR1HWP6_9HYPO